MSNTFFLIKNIDILYFQVSTYKKYKIYIILNTFLKFLIIRILTIDDNSLIKN